LVLLHRLKAVTASAQTPWRKSAAFRTT
jgi:hypothetical protein